MRASRLAGKSLWGRKNRRLQRNRRLGCEPLEGRAMLAAAFADFDDPNPSPGNLFGHYVLPLSTGNVVVTAPNDDYGGADAGAVYLFNGATGALISAIRGSHSGDAIGYDGVSEVGSGNFVFISTSWDDGGTANVGAVTWGSGTAGVKGTVSAANSLVGGTASDQIGVGGVAVLTNGNYVVRSMFWHDGSTAQVGAATWGSGATGVKGLVSAANSLVGSTAGDEVGSGGVTPLTNGNYVVKSSTWDNGAENDAGAVTWGSGTTGVKGVVSAANSLVGSTANDYVGGNGVTALTNGNYVVNSSTWDNGAETDAGAATWGSGTAGVKGNVSAANSLVGGMAYDQVGYSVTALTNGNYVVNTSDWDNSATVNVGAVTWGSGTTGVKGLISAANSLVGSTANDYVGGGGVTALTNGNYVVCSYSWNNGATINAGAATWGNGATGVKGVISAANSLVGSTAGDHVGNGGVKGLSNGNYVVASYDWDNGATVNAGAATWGSGTTGVTGTVSAANSLVGSTVGDQVGIGMTALTNGNYVVSSANWDDGGVINAGAATWGSGATGVKGTVSVANSLIGSTAFDLIGIGGVTALSNGNYVVRSPSWETGGAEEVGAVTWGSGTTGVTGVVSAANSLVGSTAFDYVGEYGVTALSNGNYVVNSYAWDNGATANVGAVTWGSGTTGVQGVISAANSLIGSTAGDHVGNGGVKGLSNGNYVVASYDWDNGATVNAGAATWGSGTAGITGVITGQNSALGAAAETSLVPAVIADDVNGTFFARFVHEGEGRVRVGSQYNGFLPTPLITSFGTGVSYTENASPVLISSTATVSDVDSADFAGGQVRVSFTAHGQASDRLGIRNQGTGAGQINVLGNQVRIGTTVIGTFAGGVGTTPLVITLNSQATPWRTQQILRNITYRNVSDAPSTLPRKVRVTVSDGDSGTSAPVTKQISVTAVNDAPVLDNSLSPTLPSVAEDATNPAGAQVSTLLVGAVTDPDAGALWGIAVTAASDSHGTWQFSTNGGTTWQAMGEPTSSAARLLAGWTRIRFVPDADFNGTVNLYYRAWDQTQGTNGGTFNTSGHTGGSNSLSTAYETASLTVTPMNDRPTLGLGGTIGYVHDSAAIALAPFAGVSDVDSANFSGGRLRVRITDGASASNRLAIGAGFTVDASNNVLQGATIIGKRMADGVGTHELIITFNASVTPAIAQQLARAITFKTVGGAAGLRRVVFTVSDGDGGVSDEATKSVNVT